MSIGGGVLAADVKEGAQRTAAPNLSLRCEFQVVTMPSRLLHEAALELPAPCGLQRSRSVRTVASACIPDGAASARGLSDSHVTSIGRWLSA
jgi:hypothetical protein